MYIYFFFKETATTDSYTYLHTLSLHDALPILGQIYIPAVNWLQCMVMILAVVGFGSSTNLAAAYGIAVTVTMLMTTILTFFVIRYKWRYKDRKSTRLNSSH